MLRTGPPNLPVLIVIDADVVNARFVQSVVQNGQCMCLVRYSGNMGDYAFLNGLQRTCMAASVFPESERAAAKAAAAE